MKQKDIVHLVVGMPQDGRRPSNQQRQENGEEHAGDDNGIALAENAGHSPKTVMGCRGSHGMVQSGV